MQWSITIPFQEYISNRCDIERILQSLEDKYYAKIDYIEEIVKEDFW